MKRYLAVLALVLGAIASPAAAQFRIELTDDNVAAQGGNDSMLRNAIDRVIFADGPLQGELMRVGLEHGCLLVHEARRQALDSNRSAFRPHLIAAMRVIVPAEAMATRTNIIIGGLAAYRSRVTAEVERTAAPVFERAVAEARSRAAARLAGARTVPAAEAAGRFADWRLDTPISRENACMLVVASRGRTPEEFALMKGAFDQFYSRSGN